MTVTVSVFNANTDSVNVNVNNSITEFSISGTTAALGYFPLMPAAAVAPTFGSQPSGNVFAPGRNSLLLAPTSSSTATLLNVDIPTSQPIVSLQLYLFWEAATSIGYLLLNDGQVISSDFVPFGSPS